MRWRFAETAEELAHKQKVLAAIDAWWEAFRDNEAEIRKDIAGKSDLDLPAFMQRWLGAVSPRIAFEFGPGSEAGHHRLAITPEEQLELVPLAEEIVRRAPALPGWEFLDHRPPWPASWAVTMMKTRTGHPCDQWHVIVGRTEVGHKLQLRFLADGCRRSEDPEFKGRALRVIEVLLGDKVLRDWVGPVMVDPLPRQRAFVLFGKTTVGSPHSVPIAQLPEQARAQMELIRGALPEEPCFRLRHGSHWTYGQKPAPALDYERQTDHQIGSGVVEGLFQGVRAGYFCSETFSRAGETFCYLKIDGSAGLDGCVHDDRDVLEKELDRKLVEAGLGCRVGGGSGLRYAYVELALVALPRALELVRQVLERSWILFHDAALASEWLGIYPTTPPPPTAQPGQPSDLRPNRIPLNRAHTESL
jgi:hypothetical protein